MERIIIKKENRLSLQCMNSLVGGAPGDTRQECQEDTNHGCNGDVSISVFNDEGQLMTGMTVMNTCATAIDK
jgi:hypothetical protein